MKTEPCLFPVHGRSPDAPVMLAVERLSKAFAINGSAVHQVLKEIDFTVRKGELICILGRSGCGKSTLLKIVAGFVAPSAGGVRLNGRPITQPGPDRCVVFQEDALFAWLSVRENIAFGLKGRPMAPHEKKREVGRFLELVGLSAFGDFLPSEISGGMKQRVSLARVLILRPQVLLMDEPFAALDAQTRAEMQDLLLDLWAKLAHTVLFVTHDVGEAVLLADRILLLGKDPGCIKKEFNIDLPRPREKDTQKFMALTRSVTEQLKIQLSGSNSNLRHTNPES